MPDRLQSPPPGAIPPSSPPAEMTEEQILQQFTAAKTMADFEAASAALSRLRGQEPQRPKVRI